MSFGFGFGSALRGLNAARYGMQVAGNNVANANTAGYSRQRVDLTAALPYSLGNGLQIGTGVDVRGITRLVDEGLERRLQMQLGLVGGFLFGDLTALCFFGMFAGVYHWYPKMFGRYLNNTLAYIHFWVTIIGAYLIFWPMHYEGLAGMPRRYFDYSNWESFKMFGGLNEFISTVAMIVFAAQFLFVFNFFYSMWKGRKVRTQNPWGANTLEWTTPINPGHGNWPGEIPEVHRWAYDYSKDGKDFIDQTTPVGPDESKH